MIQGSVIDVGEWSRLAHQDPEAFERRRQEALQAAIAEAPESRQPALRAMQQALDAALYRGLAGPEAGL